MLPIMESNTLKPVMTIVTGPVNSLDRHPTKPWMLCALDSGFISIWNWNRRNLVLRTKMCDSPLRTAKFFVKMILGCGDDNNIHVYDTVKKEKYEFEAHDDWVRCIAVHPTYHCFLSCGGNVIKLWSYEEDTWCCIRMFISHTDRVNHVVFDHNDQTKFASASSDKTIRVWYFLVPDCYLTSKTHTRGMNYVEYLGDGSYLISRDEGGLVQIWDYKQNLVCVERNQLVPYYLTAADVLAHHPEIFISLAHNVHDNDIFASVSLTIEQSEDRVLAKHMMCHTNIITIGTDVGISVFEFNKNRPVMSLGKRTGQILSGKHSQVIQIKLETYGMKLYNGNIVPAVRKDRSKFGIAPWKIAHDPTGNYVVICNDIGQFIVSTAIGFKFRIGGEGRQFVWSNESEYAVWIWRDVIEVQPSTKFFLDQYRYFRTYYTVRGITGGPYLGVKSRKFIKFYDWKTLELVICLHIDTQDVYWTGNYIMCLTNTDGFYIYFHHSLLLKRAYRRGNKSLLLIYNGKVRNEYNENVISGMWIGYCFIFTTSGRRLNYCVIGNQVVMIAPLNRTMYVLGYICSTNRLFLYDDQSNIVSYELPNTVIESQREIIDKDFKSLKLLQPHVPPVLPENKSQIAKLLVKGNLQETNDIEPAVRFELAIIAGELTLAQQQRMILFNRTNSGAISSRVSNNSLFPSDVERLHSWFQNHINNTKLVFNFTKADIALIEQTAEEALHLTEYIISFYGFYMIKRMDKCMELLKIVKHPLANYFDTLLERDAQASTSNSVPELRGNDS